jgi:hypothetical protein
MCVDYTDLNKHSPKDPFGLPRIDQVIDSTAGCDLLCLLDCYSDLEETFASMREYQWKLNPKKCIFGVPSGKLLGFIISHRGIEANPEKISTITKMKAPTCIKDVQKLTGCMAALNRFISKLRERGLPFFKLLKHQEKIVWTPEADQALSYGPPWDHCLGGYQHRLLGGSLRLLGLCRTTPDGMGHKDYGGEVLG